MRNLMLFGVLGIFLLAFAAGCETTTQVRQAEQTTQGPQPPPPSAQLDQPYPPPATEVPDGKALFDANCASCHFAGGNTIDPKKSLVRANLTANGILNRDDIVRLMRNPGSGMPMFGTDRLSDAQAQAIADYIMTTF